MSNDEDEHESEVDAERRREKDRIRAFEALEAGEAGLGWTEFQRLLAQRITDEGSALLEPSAGVDGLVKMEFQKGLMRGMVFARDLVRVTLLAYRERKQ